MRSVLKFAAALAVVSMFSVSQAQAHSHGSSCGGSRGSSHCGSHHDGHHGNCNGKGNSGKGCPNPGGWNTIHPIPSPTQPSGGNLGGFHLPVYGPVAFGNLNNKPAAPGLYTGGLLGGHGGRPPMTPGNGQIPTLGTGFSGLAGAVGQDVGKGVTGVLNAGGAVVGGVAKGVGSVVNGVADGVGDVASGIGSALGDIF